MKFIEFKAPDKYISVGSILEDYFKRYLKDFSYSTFKKNPIVYVSDRRIRTLNFKVKPKAKIIFIIDDGKEFQEPKVVFENKQLVVFDKVCGLSTQSTLKKHETSLFDLARLHYLIEKNFPGGLPYVGLHHRLDRDTSGLVLMTKQRSANKEVSDLFKNRKIKKTYLAFVSPEKAMGKKQWSFECQIERGFSKRHPFIFKVSEKGEFALSDFEWIESQKKFHLLKCYPKTGRTHQLRVQLAHQDFPILGDRVYGRKATAQRLMLHAYGLEFPFAGELLKVNSSLGDKELKEFIV